MASTNRLLGILFLGAIASAIGACASPAVQECGKSGVYCPKGTHCAAVQGICIPDANTCGDGHLDPGEVCDDGNTLDGDGCSRDCKSDESCGNGQVDPTAHIPEQCDDGPNNGKLGDPCSAACQLVKCGNGVVEQGEQCDDSNITSGDGCSATCQREYCGNGYIDTAAGEVCDDGDKNGKPGDPCSANCRSNLSCGNKNVDPGEECDNGAFGDGNPTGNLDSNDCRLDCQFNRCGDGFIDTEPGSRQEECDDGHLDQLVPVPTETAGCNIDCTKEKCGDGKVNRAAGEQCDDGNTTNNDGCSATCQFERCGNSLLDPQEECDGGAGLQPCNLQTCLQERCGNGILDDDTRTGVHEQCDDHNTNNNDGCSSACVVEFCGDGVTNNHELCDPTDPQFGLARCNTDCTPTSCGDGKLDHAAGEQCDDGNTINGDGCSATCQFERCGNGVLDPEEQCDGTLGLQPCNTQTCLQEICGNGVLDNDNATGVHEQCDDGNIADNDGCSALCKREFCGDGILNNGEACDHALAPATCNLDCTLSSCGDGKLNTFATPPEQCDDGGTSSGDGCSATCQFEHCGNGVVDAFEECDGTAGLQPCSASCHQERCGNGILDRDPANGISEQCDDGNATNGDGCSSTCQFEFCGDGIVNNGEACDRALTPATCNLDCTLSSCGDGKLNTFAIPPEQCDDGGTTSGDGCSATCQLEHCGNGVVDAFEECDGTVGLQPCSASCHQEICGNGILDRDPVNGISEQCDDGNITNGDGCSSTCRFEFCGDGIVNNGEACDRALTPATCNLDCTLSSCGDGKLNAFATPPEQCDDGGTTSGDGCSATCRLEHCGNGVVDAFEECDGTAGFQPCSASCHQEICGNGVLDRDPANGISEQCDDGNTTNGDGCSATCQLERCGNGVLDPQEQCDGTLGLQPCNTQTCLQEICGNGILDRDPANGISEQCDDANTAPGDGCSPDCHFETCGNGIKDPGEDCDEGTKNGTLSSQCSTTCHTIKCGNGVLEQGEDCDDNNQITENCPYGATSCKVCDKNCKIADGATSLCGDGIVDGAALEACDDGNTSCGACSSDCRAVTSEFALGSIVVPTGDHFQTGDTFVVSDGGTVAIFEFTVVLDASPAPISPALDIIPITITNSAANGPELSKDIATAIADAIDANLQITATPQSRADGTTVIGLRHRFKTSNGNQPIVSQFAENPSAFQVAGMAGGQGGNCAATQACTQDADCASTHCVLPIIGPSVIGVCGP